MDMTRINAATPRQACSAATVANVADVPMPPGPPSALYPARAAMTASLRVGLLVDAAHVPAWIARVVEQIEAGDCARVVTVVVNGAAAQTESRWQRLRHALFRRYAQRDTARRRAADSALHACDLRPLLARAEWISATAARGAAGLRLPDAALARIGAAHPDVLLRFGFPDEAMEGDLLDIARHGVWSYQFGEHAMADGEAQGFREMQERTPVTRIVLQRLRPRAGAADILYRAQAATHAHSLELSRENCRRRAPALAIRCLRRLAAGGSLPVTAPEPDQPRPAARRGAPGNASMLRFLAGITVHKLRALVDDRRCVSHWFVAWRRTHAPLDPAAPRLQDMRELPCPSGHFYADPFLHRHRGQDWLFVEDFDYAIGKANLAVIPWGIDGPSGDARTILDLGVHLSYPFVFEWQGNTWLMPESGAARRLSLFRAKAFPDQWEFHCDLLQGHRVVDATLHEHRGRWYLFANVVEGGGSADDELFLFHADTPLGPFQPHPCNPIVADVRRARSAGRLFVHEGRLIRPAQDCALRYGHAVTFNEVLELGPHDYRERPIGRLAPDWARALIGCHTWAALDDLQVTDGNRMVPRRSVGAPPQ